MSNPNNELIKNVLTFGLTFVRQSQEQQQEIERKIAARKARERAIRVQKDLLIRRNKLADKLSIIIERLPSASDKEIACARLNQILHADLNQIPEYEQKINLDYCRRPNIIAPVGILDFLNMINEPAQAQIKEDEKKINISQYSSLERLADDIKSGELTCAICLEKFAKEDKNIEIRRCLHTFHKQCLIPWETSGRTQGKTCPCCRQ